MIMRSFSRAVLDNRAARHLRPVPAVPPTTSSSKPCPHEHPDYVEARIAEERAQAVTKALSLITRPHYDGRGQAAYVLLRSVHRQARLAGVDAPGLLGGPGGCPCGGRCGA